MPVTKAICRARMLLDLQPLQIWVASLGFYWKH